MLEDKKCYRVGGIQRVVKLWKEVQKDQKKKQSQTCLGLWQVGDRKYSLHTPIFQSYFRNGDLYSNQKSHSFSLMGWAKLTKTKLPLSIEWLKFTVCKLAKGEWETVTLDIKLTVNKNRIRKKKIGSWYSIENFFHPAFLVKSISKHKLIRLVLVCHEIIIPLWGRDDHHLYFRNVLRQWQTKWYAQGHTLNRLWRWDLNPDNLIWVSKLSNLIYQVAFSLKRSQVMEISKNKSCPRLTK